MFGAVSRQGLLKCTTTRLRRYGGRERGQASSVPPPPTRKLAASTTTPTRNFIKGREKQQKKPTNLHKRFEAGSGVGDRQNGGEKLCDTATKISQARAEPRAAPRICALPAKSSES